MTARERRDDFVHFMRKLGIVCGALLALLALSRLTWGYALTNIRAHIIVDVAARDSVFNSKVDRIERRLDGMNDMLVELLKKEAKR